MRPQPIRRFITLIAMPLAAVLLSGCFLSSPFSNYNSLGVYYRMKAMIDMTGPDHDPIGATYIATANGGIIPAGYMGGRARVYFSNGVMCTGTGSVYSDAPAYSMTIQKNFQPDCEGNAYFSKGRAYFYNAGTPDNYARFDTYPSPTKTA